MKSKNLKNFFPLFTALFMILLLILPVGAVVITTKEGGCGIDAVYVAGNPDLYPLEFYNKSTEQYEGIIPLILEEISKDTGLNFCYISAGSKNEQRRMAKNRQIEMLTAYKPHKDLDEYLAETKIIFNVIYHGEPLEVALAFTKVAPEELIERISLALEQIPDKDIAEIVLSYTIGKEAPKNPLPTLLIAISVLAVSIILAGTIVASVLKRRHEQQQRQDITTEAGNKLYYIHNFNLLISENNSSLYYLAQIGFDIKWTNDFLGEEAANRILIRAADTLSSLLRRNDFMARVSGGAFAYVIYSHTPIEAEEYIDKIMQTLNSSSDEGYRVRFYAGVYPIGAGDLDAEEALRKADRCFQRAMREEMPYFLLNSYLLREANMEQQMRERASRGLIKSEFWSRVQFIVDSKSGEITGGEMLSCWQNPDFGLLMPGRYLKIIEELGTIIELDLHIFEETCRKLQSWAEKGLGHLQLSCNFSRQTISQANFADRLVAIVEQYQFKRDRLIIEITEDIKSFNKEQELENVMACRNNGFRVALDDVGSGYTSFINLADYALDFVKVDRSLVVKAANTENGATVLMSIIKMAHNMGLKVVCEGVESDEEDAAVKTAGCDYIQGYRYSRAIPIEEADRYMQLYKSR